MSKLESEKENFLKNPADYPRSVIAFDFDGVISDSVHDSFVTALNAYLAFVPGNRLPLASPIEPAGRIFQYEQEEPGLFAQFLSLLPMGNRAEDYYVILRAVEQACVDKISSQDDFESFRNAIDSGTREAFHTFFYRHRIERQDADPEAWARLLPAFPGIPETIRELSRRFILAIATAKDRRSVELQLKHYGLTDCFAPENILDKDVSASKRGHLVRLHERLGTPYPDIHFIDDKVLHLLDVSGLGVTCYLSMWGYNSAREHDIAREKGFTLLDLDRLGRIGDPG